VTIETSLTRLLGLSAPIVQAPIGGLTNPRLAAAVSNAGGLGMLAIGFRTVEDIRENLRATKALTSRPFGVNLIIDEPQEERLAVALEDGGVKLVSFFWGDPARYLPAVHAAGALASLTTGSAAEAKQAVDDGVDIIVAQGWEAGGHVWGEVSTLALVPAVVDGVGSGVPVIAAGGITDGRGLAAALALGAGGGWMGTRFVAAEETGAHPDYLARLLVARETDTFHSSLFDIGWPDAPHRTLRNATIEAWLAAGRPPSGQRPGEGDILAHRADGSEIVRYQSISVRDSVSGNVADLSLWAGQGAGLVHDVLPAGEIVRRVTAQAEAVLAALAKP